MSFARPINVLRRAGKAKARPAGYTGRKYAKIVCAKMFATFHFAGRKLTKLVLCITVLEK